MRSISPDDRPAARRCVAAGLAIARDLVQAPLVANLLNPSGLILDRERHAAARQQSEESLAMHRAVGSATGVAGALTNPGMAAAARSHHPLPASPRSSVSPRPGTRLALAGAAVGAVARLTQPLAFCVAILTTSQRRPYPGAARM
jgi:hypothetical protein